MVFPDAHQMGSPRGVERSATHTDKGTPGDFVEPDVDSELSRKQTFKDEDNEVIIYVRPEWKKKIERFLENWWTVGTMMIVTIYALFFDDFRRILLPPE